MASKSEVMAFLDRKGIPAGAESPLVRMLVRDGIPDSGKIPFDMIVLATSKTEMTELDL